MEANLNSHRIRLKDTSKTVTVPGNDIARLMYYLGCVFTVLKCNNFSKFTDFNNYDDLSNSDIIELIRLVKLFNPKIMIGAKVFVLEEDLDCNNRFIEITDEAMNIRANEEIVIGGIVTKVSKKMLLKNEWLIFNYFNPLKRIIQRIYSPPPTLPTNPPINNYPAYYPSYNTYSNNYNYDYNYNYNFNSTNDEELCCCEIF